MTREFWGVLRNCRFLFLLVSWGAFIGMIMPPIWLNLLVSAAVGLLGYYWVLWSRRTT